MSTNTSKIEAASVWLTTTQLALHYGVDDDTVRRWMNRGINTPSGRVFLKARRIGGWRKTTLEWAEEFMDALNSGESLPPTAETPAQREASAKKEHEKAKKALGGEKEERICEECKSVFSVSPRATFRRCLSCRSRKEKVA